MVRILTIGLILIYAFSATGATVHLHYCCGKLQELSMEDEQSSSQDNCALCLHNDEKGQPLEARHTSNQPHCPSDMPSQNHCQEDIQVDAQKTTGDHLPGSDKSLLKIQSLELLVFTLAYILDYQPHSYVVTETENAVPLGSATPLFIEFCSYRT